MGLHIRFCRLLDKDYSSADSSFISIPPNEWNFDNIVFIMKRNFESNIPMGYRRKLERAQMMQRSDVYGTDIFNDGITASIREVSPCRDRVCGEFDVPVGKVDCPQYEADAESTDVK